MAAAGGGTAPCGNCLFVAALDFGTTYSGYAFSSRDDFIKEPLKINANVWNAGTRSLLSTKAPTVLLLNSDASFHSFGYDAETNYAELMDEEEDYKQYYYFHRFKMLLHNNKRLRRNTKIKDQTGKSLDAMIVFSLSIKFLKDKLFQSIVDKVPEIIEEDIHYVLTVPAIWDDNAKQFMREAAVKAGIKKDQLSIALEPEAASIYCQNLPVERQAQGQSTFLQAVKSGTKYMVADLGGGTADITVHQRARDGSLQELRPASGGAWGGKAVDDTFEKFLQEVIGEDVIDTLRADYLDDYLELTREFETKKRVITSQKTGKVNMMLRVTISELVKRFKGDVSIGDVLMAGQYKDQVSWKTQKLQIAVDLFRQFFKQTIHGIITLIEDALSEENACNIDNILLVGGFADCELVQRAIKDKFKNKRVIIPDEAGLAVLRGAVLFGHTSKPISLRVSRHTYGIQSWPIFDPKVHPVSKKVLINGIARCKDVFFKYITRGEQIRPGYERSQTFQALKPGEDTLECTVYASTERDPVFVTDNSCRRLGVLTVPLPPGAPLQSLEIEEVMVFGETELLMQAKDRTRNKTYEAQFNTLAEDVSDSEC